ncbi:MAG: beta-N-acetylhexosaminidase [Deltaproteobacteria bacterium]|nr:MAG: beta-N-acetylhexosaminidase [Deltaproteobacteria bacterium]
MTVDRAVARLLFFGFDGHRLDAQARRLLAAGAGGVILFRRNVRDAEQVRALIDAIRQAAAGPVLVAVDQEGGRVARLRGITTDLPPMRQVRSVDDARSVGAVLGRELSALGFDLNFAPVVDVDTNPANPVIGDRSFSRDPEVVARLAAALIEAMQEQGVAACAKHFPGHGDTEADSHHALPVLRHGPERLAQVELLPFRAAVEAGVASVMTAHLLLPALDPETPATGSKAVLSLLRDGLGFDGLTVSDDLEMKAIAGHHAVPEFAVRAVRAGVDQVLVCHRARLQWAVLEALDEAVQRDPKVASRVEEAGRRIETVWRRFGARPRKPAALRSPDALALARRLGAPPAGADPTGDR